MRSETWGEHPPIEEYQAPNQEPAEYIADFLDQWADDEEGYYQEILRMAVELLRNRKPL